MAGNAGINRLARLLRKQIDDSKTPERLELGTIQDNYDLLLDTFPYPLAPNCYMVCRTLTLPQDRMSATANGGAWPAADESNPAKEGKHAHGGTTGGQGLHGGHVSGTGQHAHTNDDPNAEHYHTVLTPPQLRPLWPGDRVLVAWVNEGNDPVIIDIVVPGDKVKKKDENKWTGPIPI